MSNFSSSCSPYLVSSTICVALVGAVRREKYGSRRTNVVILEMIVMDEATKEGRLKVFVFQGRNVEGFNKFLTERNLNVIETEILALYVLDAMRNFERRDREASNLLIQEILHLVNVEDADTAVDVTRQFARLCDTYRTLFQTLTGKENVTEEKEQDA